MMSGSLNQKSKICDKKIRTAEAKVSKIMKQMEILKLNNYYTTRIHLPNKNKELKVLYRNYKYIFVTIVISILLGLFWWWYAEFSSSRCILELSSWSRTAFRPPVDCEVCAGVKSVVRLTNTSSRVFEEYAYSATPVIVTDAVRGWKAVEDFNFKFFAEFYKNGKMGKQINECFFFSYKSGLRSLDEVFSMDEQRANLSGAPWYIGWSTCFDQETRKLREYYSRPYFIPETSESDMVDWIFMGGPGQGAHMHVDSVRHMSWQAQLRGRKRWVLAPAPECLYRCSWIEFIVEPTEILVVDTNRWYHKTDVLPGDISITIGAEYD